MNDHTRTTAVFAVTGDGVLVRGTVIDWHRGKRLSVKFDDGTVYGRVKKGRFSFSARDAWERRCKELKAEIQERRNRLVVALRTQHALKSTARPEVLDKYNEVLFEKCLAINGLQEAYEHAVGERDECCA